MTVEEIRKTTVKYIELMHKIEGHEERVEIGFELSLILVAEIATQLAGLNAKLPWLAWDGKDGWKEPSSGSSARTAIFAEGDSG